MLRDATRRPAQFLLVIAFASPTPFAHATRLTFDQAQGIPSGNDDTYGDNVTVSPDSNGHSYGIGPEGPTPNIEVSYSPNIFLWSANYGNLSNVAYVGGASLVMEITLTADTGSLVELLSFEMGGWSRRDHTIDAVEVLDSGGGPLFTMSNVHIEGDSGHSDFEFMDPLVDSTLTIRYDVSSVASPANIGIDNIIFRETLAIPEPTCCVLTLVCLLGFGRVPKT